MKVTYLGTTTLLFDDGEDQLLFDCHVTRPSIARCLFGRLSTDARIADRVIREHEIRQLRGIFVSHTHHDHVLDVPYFAAASGACVYGSESALNVARGGGVPEEQLHAFSLHTEYRIGTFCVKVLPAVHSIPFGLNNDLGETIDRPLVQPARFGAYKEGGSHDFLIAHGAQRYLIHPSCNYIENQFAKTEPVDVLFLSIGGLSRENKDRQKAFFAHTVDALHPGMVIPIHWDHFFRPLYGPVRSLPRPFEDTGISMRLLAEHCAKAGIPCLVQLPLTGLNV